MFSIKYIFSEQNYVFPVENELATNFFLHYKGEFFRSVDQYLLKILRLAPPNVLLKFMQGCVGVKSVQKMLLIYKAICN